MRRNERSILCRALIVVGLLVTGLCFSPILPTTQAASGDVTVVQPPYGGCPAPNEAGVNVCRPGYPYETPGVPPGATPAIDSPFQVIATGTGGNGPVELMELWADGKKITQVAGNLFDEPVTLSEGTHQLTVVELDTTGAYVKSTPFNVDVSGSTAGEYCTTPGAPGVHVCSPTYSSTCQNGGPTTFIAAGTGASGEVSRMELWIGSVKMANFDGDKINTNIFLTNYINTVTIIEVDSKGAYIKSLLTITEAC